MFTTSMLNQFLNTEVHKHVPAELEAERDQNHAGYVCAYRPLYRDCVAYLSDAND